MNDFERSVGVRVVVVVVVDVGGVRFDDGYVCVGLICWGVNGVMWLCVDGVCCVVRMIFSDEFLFDVFDVISR